MEKWRREPLCDDEGIQSSRRDEKYSRRAWCSATCIRWSPSTRRSNGPSCLLPQIRTPSLRNADATNSSRNTKNRTDPQSLALSLLLASPVTSASSCTTSIPVRVTYHAHTLSVQAPGYMWRVSTQAGFTLSSRLPRWRTSGVDEKWHGCQHGKHFFLLGSSSQV